MLSVEEYQALDAEAKKAYQYYEYTDPSGKGLTVFAVRPLFYLSINSKYSFFAAACTLGTSS